MPASGFYEWKSVAGRKQPDYIRPKGGDLFGLAASEIIFLAEESPEGRPAARAVGESIFRQAATMPELHAQVRDAVRCHFDADAQPKLRAK